MRLAQDMEIDGFLQPARIAQVNKLSTAASYIHYDASWDVHRINYALIHELSFFIAVEDFKFNAVLKMNNLCDIMSTEINFLI